MIEDRHHKQMREAVERQRFGMTRHEFFMKHGTTCVDCKKTFPESQMVIDHEAGGGRHATENGMMPQLAHDESHMMPRCKECAGRRDRIRGSMGLGIEGNGNNPSQ